MGKINVLSADVAALIAAGEVVERPASVIKELIENSVDAGATAITVEIKNGGIKYMRVTDNGSGISPDDIENAFLRHATSKIVSQDDLESIVTLGFRGEALHSIAAVSKVEVMTAQKDADGGTFARLEAGNMLEVSPIGCPVGTTIIVRELFFNTPARMKFLKKDSTEGGYVEDIVRKTALGRPDISFKFINNGKEIFFTPGDNNLKNTVYAIYGRDIAAHMIEASYEGDGVRAYGLIGKSELSRGNRSFQTFFVNGRCVQNKSFFFALTEAYKNQIMTGRFPVAVMNIEMNPSLCDVNVHPSKAEIKFANDKPVYDALYWAAKNALYSVNEIRNFKLNDEDDTAGTKIPEIKSVFDTIKPVKTEVSSKTMMPREIISSKPGKTDDEEDHIQIQMIAPPALEQNESTLRDETVEHVKSAPAPVVVPEEKNIKVIGQLFSTYIVSEIGNDMVLIDQHAAHERIIYNRIMEMAQKNAVSSQMLMMAETLKLAADEFAVAIENKEFFESIGFDIEEFGNNTIRIITVPTTLGSEDAALAVTEMLDVLRASRKVTQTKARDQAIYTFACRAALKAGKQLSLKEQEELTKKALLLDGDPTCPHGRPIVLRLTKHQIEKQFKRIV